MHKRIAFALTLSALVGGLPAVAAPNLGLGGGLGTAIGNQFKIGALELFTETRGDSWLSGRITLCYLPPLMPNEELALLAAAGVRLAYGQSLRPFLVLSGGAVIEPMPFRGMVPNPAWVVTAGCEVWLNRSLGFYVSASIAVAQRQRPEGPVAYPYFPWTVGLLISAPRADPRRPLPVGVEK